VDSILSKLKAHPEMLPEHIPLFRLEDTGMGQQMQEYAVSQVLHWFRRFDDYQALNSNPTGSRCRSISAKILPSAFWARACSAQKWRKPCPVGIPAALLEPQPQRLSGCGELCRNR
jgi:hypothetical protein